MHLTPNPRRQSRYRLDTRQSSAPRIRLATDRAIDELVYELYGLFRGHLAGVDAEVTVEAVQPMRGAVTLDRPQGVPARRIVEEATAGG